MLRKTFIYLSLIIIVLFTGCKQNPINIPKKKVSSQKVQLSLNNAVVSLAEQLSQNNKLALDDKGTITLTSFVDLSKLNKTSQLGRILGESLFSELFTRGFNITDFRGKNTIVINDNGEFYITRDATKLNNKVPNTYILVGTYSKINDNIIINSRILDNKTGKIVSSARVMYTNDDCYVYGICNNNLRKIKLVGNNTKNLIASKSQSKKKILF